MAQPESTIGAPSTSEEGFIFSHLGALVVTSADDQTLGALSVTSGDDQTKSGHGDGEAGKLWDYGGSSVCTSEASVYLDSVVVSPNEHSDPAWKEYCEVEWKAWEKEFLHEYRRLAPLLKKLTGMQGPLYKSDGLGERLPVPRAEHWPVLEALVEAVEDIKGILVDMEISALLREGGPVGVHLKAKAAKLRDIVRKFEHEDLVSAATSKGFKIGYLEGVTEDGHLKVFGQNFSSHEPTGLQPDNDASSEQPASNDAGSNDSGSNHGTVVM